MIKRTQKNLKAYFVNRFIDEKTDRNPFIGANRLLKSYLYLDQSP